MHLEIVTPDQNIFNGEIDSVIFPGSDGSFGVQNNHAPMVATLKIGKIEVTHAGKREEFEITGGVVEINHNKIIVLAD